MSKTLYYLGAGLDTNFLFLLPKYDKYELFDIRNDEDFKNKVKQTYGKYENINYHTGFDTKDIMDLDGDVYISGYYPDWFDMYNFKGFVFFHCGSVHDKPINAKVIDIGGCYNCQYDCCFK